MKGRTGAGRWAALPALLAAVSAATPVRGQSTSDPSSYADIVGNPQTRDINNVDRATGQIRYEKRLFSIGQERKLELTYRNNFPIIVTDEYSPINLKGSIVDYNYYAAAWTAVLPFGSYSTAAGSGNSISGTFENCYVSGPHTILRQGQVITRDGHVAEYQTPSHITCGPPSRAQLVKLTFPDGEIWTFQANGVVRSNRGYGFKDLVPFNEAYTICDWNSAAACPALASSPQISMVNSFPDNIITDADGRVTRVPAVSPMANNNFTQSVRFDSTPERNILFNVYVVPFTMSGARYGHVTSVTRGGSTWNYQFQPPAWYNNPASTNPNDYKSTVTMTDPLTKVSSTVAFTFPYPYIISSTDELSRTTTFSYSGETPTGSTLPEGNSTLATLDGRGNAVDIAINPKAGGGAALHLTAGFPTSCAAIKTCNKPLWTRDALGNQTDYTYDNAHGGVISVTGPAVGGVRPQTRYAYAQRHAWVLNTSGVFVQAATPIWLLTQESSCRASSATGNPAAPCAGNDETLVAYDYGPDAGPNNLFLRGKVVTADGVSLRTCYTNDRWGNRISETKPRAGLTSCP